MDTGEFFQNVARRNYFEFFERGDDIRLLWNAVVSMNSVAEYLALHQHNYAPISKKQLARTANQIREQHHLLDLKYCAETFKHIRKIKDHGRRFIHHDWNLDQYNFRQDYLDDKSI